jgi:hypothetical protein
MIIISDKRKLADLTAEHVMKWKYNGIHDWNGPAKVWKMNSGENEFYWDPVNDWNCTMRLRKKSCSIANHEWIFLFGTWTLRKFENQFPVIVASYSYEDEQISICIGALNAAGFECEWEDEGVDE